MATKKVKNKQGIIVYGLITTAVIQFIYALGFMTNFYNLFYEGTTEMFDFYKRLQVVNQFIFRTSLVILIVTILLLAFDLNKHSKSFFGPFVIFGLLLYTVYNFTTIFPALVYYANIYKRFDFSQIANYTARPEVFYLGIAIMSICILLETILFLSVIIMKRSAKNA